MSIVKHEYLEAENYYESRSVNKGRSSKTCEHCGGNIPVGMKHDMHHFYPEFQAYAVHINCHDDFIASLLTEEDLLKQKENDNS